jgi:2-C-methyl-D-erythritol 4-phosphate cytidylyltransferase/2-C-methyl-D-erythritol 2,4-cyclodiphosphate synthase
VRAGIGFDAHRFAPGRKLVLGGVEIPFDRGLDGHSDADVLAHAICDAVLGAAGLGDIGSRFPSADPRWEGASSLRFLERAAGLIAGGGGTIQNVDATLICEAPPVLPHAEDMASRIARALRIAPARVSVKATSTDGLGFTGRGEGIAAMAVALVEMPP